KILIGDDGNVAVRTPRELHSETRPAIEPSVGLPAVNDPRLDLQFVSHEYLRAHAVEEPRRIRRDVRWLVRPVVELVETEKPDVGKENSRVNVYAVQRVEMIAAVCFGDVAIRIRQIPLTS